MTKWLAAALTRSRVSMTAQLLPADATGPPLSLSSCAVAAFIHMLCVAGTASLVKAQCTSVQYPLQWRGWRRARSGRSACPMRHHRHRRHARTTTVISSTSRSNAASGRMRRHAHAAPRRRRQIARIWQVREPIQSTAPFIRFIRFTTKHSTNLFRHAAAAPMAASVWATPLPLQSRPRSTLSHL